MGAGGGNVSPYRATIGTDEKKFELFKGKGNEKMWVDSEDLHPDERYVPKVQKPPSVMVWTTISGEGGQASMHFHAESVCQDVYQKCIDEAFWPCVYDSEYLATPHRVSRRFMQDGASAHKAKRTIAHLKKKFPSSWEILGPTMGWPALGRRIVLT